jgi:hypothetical protein
MPGMAVNGGVVTLPVFRAQLEANCAFSLEISLDPSAQDG